LKPSADSAELEQGRCEDDGDGLHEHVSPGGVGELVGEDAVELGRRQRREEPCADDDRLPSSAVAGRQSARIPVGNQMEPGHGDFGAGGEALDG
jgi:hypothetical protein